MSYAYIKNVYPGFKESKEYSNKLYNSLESVNPSATALTQVNNNTPAPFESDDEARFARSLLSNSELKPVSLPQLKLLETLQNTTETPNKDNLRYYNIPLPKSVETFEETSIKQDCKVDCDSHVSHVLNCPRCKGIIARQLNLDNDRVKNEEFMELFSYIIFGVFILLLIDSIKNAD